MNLPARPLKVAAITTVIRPESHGDVILSRWYAPRPSDAHWGWNGPRTQLVSIYVDQTPANDMSADICRTHDIRLCPTVNEALTLGTDTLKVDAVLLIAEHGDYPLNEIGQRLYPRKQLFDQITRTFQHCERSVPVFCDKHLSWNFEWAQQMVDTAQELGFNLAAGSSLPFCHTEPAVRPLSEFPTDEMVCVFYGGNESYGYHSVELAQSIIETRPGGETGPEAITAWKGDAVDEAQRRGCWSESLVNEAVRLLRPSHGATPPPPATDATDPDTRAAFQLAFRDGLRVTHLNLGSRVRGWAVAMKHRHNGQIHALKPKMGGSNEHFPHFATLARAVEDHWLGSGSAFPIQRTLLTTGIIDRAMRCLAQPGKRVETPELDITYPSVSHRHPLPPSPLSGRALG